MTTIEALYFTGTGDGAKSVPNGCRLYVVVRRGRKYVTLLDPAALTAHKVTLRAYDRAPRGVANTTARRVAALIRRKRRLFKRLGRLQFPNGDIDRALEALTA